jgi:hypothetical protein
MKNEEATKQMEQIWKEQRDPATIAMKKAKAKREAREKEAKEDLGLS